MLSEWKEVRAMKDVQIGDTVTYVDPYGKKHPALVTIVWRRTDGRAPGINLVYVSDNEAEQDSCGRQIKRETSVVHQSDQPAHGSYWE